MSENRLHDNSTGKGSCSFILTLLNLSTCSGSGGGDSNCLSGGCVNYFQVNSIPCMY